MTAWNWKDYQCPPDLCRTRTDHTEGCAGLRELPDRSDEVYGLLQDLCSNIRACSATFRGFPHVGDRCDLWCSTAAEKEPDRLSGRCEPASIDNILGDVINSLLRLRQDYPGARAVVFATASDMDLDLMNVLSRWLTSPFCPSDIYFPPYDADDIRERIRLGLHPGLFPAVILDRVVEQTMESGDVRLGLDLVKRAVLSAECAAPHRGS